MKKNIILIAIISLITTMLFSCSKSSVDKKDFVTAYKKDSELNLSIGLPEKDRVIAKKTMEINGKKVVLRVYLRGSETTSAVASPIEITLCNDRNDNILDEIDSILPLQSETNPTLYSAYTGKTRIDIFMDNDNNVYYEECDESGQFSDGQSFYLRGFKITDRGFEQIAQPATYVGSAPGLQEIIKLYNDYNNGKRDIDAGDYIYISNVIDKIKMLNFNPTTLGVDFPLIDTGDYQKIVRITREETFDKEKEDVTNWLNSTDANATYGNITIKIK